jgi:hypothetical protein
MRLLVSRRIETEEQREWSIGDRQPVGFLRKYQAIAASFVLIVLSFCEASPKCRARIAPVYRSAINNFSRKL